MLVFLTLVVIGAVTYSLLREGLLTAFCTLINVFLAGLLAFNFWEPLADGLDTALAGGWLHGYEDALALTGLFALAMVALRYLTNSIVPTQVEFDAYVEQGGAIVMGALAGYLLAGFLVCMLQTLPWHENFMSFDAYIDPEGAGNRVRRLLPPDRVWLALIHRASNSALGADETPGFDPKGTFEIRYARHRRYGDEREPTPSAGEALP